MATAQSTEIAATPKASDTMAERPVLRLWPAVALIAIFWAFFFLGPYIEMTNFWRFMSRLAAHALLVLGFIGWWLTRRSIGFRDRCLAMIVLAASSWLMLQVADPSINIWALFLGAAPALFTAWIVALILARHRGAATQRAAVLSAILLVLGYFALVRSDGLDGWQRGEFSWRWSPTAEQEFLAGHADASHAVPNAQVAWTLQPDDVPGFRGANRDGIVRDTKLALEWSQTQPKQIWRQRLGPGWSSLIVVDGHVVTHEQRGETEVVACYDAATGEEVWVHEDPARFHEALSGAGPRGTPVFDAGRIYSLGGRGNLNCLDALTGEPIWTRDLVAECNAAVPQWGFAVSPLVVDGKVIVFANAKEGFGLVAFDADTGEQAWSVEAGGESYSSPQLVKLDDVEQILMHDNRALRAVSAEDGRVLWERPNGSDVAIPMLQPNVVGPTRILAAIDDGLTLLEVKQNAGQWETSDVWRSNRLKPGFNDFVVHRGTIYGLDDGILCAIDLETGERLWKKGRYGHGQVLLLADQDALLVQGARGEVILVGLGGEQPEELGRFEAIEGKTWNHPALVGGRLYVRNGEEIAGYELPAAN